MGMLDEQNKKLCWDVLARYGIDAQRHMVIEECSELQKAVCKMLRKDSPEHYRNYIEELVDVIVMCQQMLLAENISMDDVNVMARLKLVRALEAGDEY
jgi:hypothetical protein